MNSPVQQGQYAAGPDPSHGYRTPSAYFGVWIRVEILFEKVVVAQPAAVFAFQYLGKIFIAPQLVARPRAATGKHWEH